MPEGRGTLTDQLINVIQVIQLGRKSGLLTVERDEGMAQERGEITFVHGQVVNAQVEHIRGQQALTWLSTWGTCRFTFVNTPDTSGLQQTTGSLPQVWPQRQRDTQPLFTPPQSITQSNSRINAVRPGNAQETNMSAPQRTRPVHEAQNLLEQTGLSRLHRHLFLLIDGSRTSFELARLIARTPEEVQIMLADLKRIGIIQ